MIERAVLVWFAGVGWGQECGRVWDHFASAGLFGVGQFSALLLNGFSLLVGVAVMQYVQA